MNQKESFSPRAFQIVYVGTAVLFLFVFCFLQPFSGRFILKAIPALSLALAFFLTPGLDGWQRWSLIVGALFCGVGDMILDIDRVRFFVPGLVAFLLGHTGFLVFFLLRWEKKTSRRVWLLPFLAFPAVMIAVLVPHLDRLLIPVLVYLTIISLMTGLAIVSDLHIQAVLGALVFMLSDALLALAKFVFHDFSGPEFTIPLYFAGLFLLGFGCLKTRKPHL
jgi:alkenylglycerophosphocholine/alkenylglycerophosphoethanolamine hydrolase